jgi:hypothetical protein
MNRTLLAPLATVALLGLPASAAQANWFFTKRGAEKATRQFVARHMDARYSDVEAYCEPHNQKFDPDFKYHTWDCGYYESGSDASGVLRLTGNKRNGGFSVKVID